MKRITSILLLCMLTLGCSLHKVTEEVTVPDAVPEGYSETGEMAVPDQWWTAFGDETLNELADRVLRVNPDLRAAEARLRQFAALAVQAGAARYPDVGGSAGASRSRSLFAGQEFELNNYELGVSVGYELDLWRRIENQAQAGGLDAAASRADLTALALSLTGSVARTWYSLIAQRELLALLSDQVAINEKLLSVIETRFANGVAGAVEVFQQRESLAAVRSQVPQARRTLDELSHLLAVLVGEAPMTSPPGDQQSLPELPPMPATGLPTDLLQNRPDIMAASLRVRAADHRIGVAIADQYPSFRLSGDTGYQSTELSDLLSGWVWSLAGSLTGPIFDAGRRRAEVDRTRAVLDERLASYEATVLQALREVEDALSNERNQQVFIARLAEQLELAERARKAAESRYLRGVGDYLTVLQTTQAAQGVAQQLVRARVTVIADRIDLYLALGGQWTLDSEWPASLDLSRGGEREGDDR